MAENGSCVPPGVEEIDFRKLLGIIWKRRFFVITLSLLLSGAIVAYDLAGFARRPPYEAFADISGDVGNPDLNARTISDVVGMGISVVDSPGNALMLRCRFEAGDEAAARRLAEEGAATVLRRVNHRYMPILEMLERELKALEGGDAGTAAVRAPLLVQVAEIRVRMAMIHDIRVSPKRLDLGDLADRWAMAFVLGLLVSSMVVMARERCL